MARYRMVLWQREVKRCIITKARSGGCRLKNLPQKLRRYPGSALCTPLIQLGTLESVVSAELRKPGQGFAWGQQWSPSAGPAQGVGSGRDIGGNIPKEVGNLSQLVELNLADNQLTGSIPAALFNISSLHSLSLAINSLSGHLLLGEGNIVSNMNVLMGGIPPELGKLSNLRQLTFDNNSNLIGQIPEAILNISSLEVISFHYNNLSGRIPTTTGLHLPNLEGLYLGHNQLEGEIPLFITNASKLEILELNNNFLTGTIPTNLGNLHELQSLPLHTNQLTNEPRECELLFLNSLTDCMMLKYLQVGSNPLNGVLPNSIGNLSSTIQNIYIRDAYINGLILTSIGNMSGLTAIDIEGNNLAGSIPPDIGSNKFSSKFLLCLWKMSGLLYLDVSLNSIEGELPSDIGALKAIVELHLSSNHFSGMIPSRFGELQNLQYLDLSNNSFFGKIPLSFANLISLEYLDLSSNALSEGEIPSGGVFANSTPQLFLGNKCLCGMHILDIPGCDITNPGKQLKLKEVVLKIVTPVVIASFVIFLLVSIWIMKRHKKGKSKDVEKVPEIGTHQLVSYHEIQRATNNFDESNLIGGGSSGSVYKGTLFGGTAVAIKVLDLENEQVCKRFDTECEVMRNVRHRNLVSVIITCSSDYIRVFVLQFMPNGSFENWLYKEDCHLNLDQRDTVMLDVAMAVEYLHHGHVTPIVH
ncbi:hypothetical protein KY284_019896 [Solanum tuberosum]|nr:hypothetical protein KY284_019896 [Solanum tuberosum]